MCSLIGCKYSWSTHGGPVKKPCCAVLECWWPLWPGWPGWQETCGAGARPHHNRGGTVQGLWPLVKGDPQPHLSGTTFLYNKQSMLWFRQHSNWYYKSTTHWDRQMRCKHMYVNAWLPLAGGLIKQTTAAADWSVRLQRMDRSQGVHTMHT